MKTVLTHTLLFILAVLELALGVIAGTVALLSLITETAARATAAGGDSLARRFRLNPFSPRLRTELAQLLAGIATPAAGGPR
ncbi:hypothetical protein [Streptomyces sp. NRRL S-241]|uniref:hypothetical protein n=1 Tax=Streptomyces sp. NRRL S-241 TaxID=1463896 RepID=UPI0004BF8069|nr:hypothetical protein [Streptomyces sp. NRRL S-241]